MTGHGGFEATAERCSVNSGNDGLGRFLDAVQDAVESRPAAAIGARSDLSELADVSSGNESAPAAYQHHGFRTVVFFELFDTCNDAVRHARTECVYGRIVDGQYSDVAVFTGEH